MIEPDHRPLAPDATRISAEENGVYSAEQSQKNSHRRKKIICCGCCAASTVIIGLIILILAFTVFKVKSPTVTFNSVKIQGLDVAIERGNTQSGLNMSFTSDISIKNPNSASFKFTNATTILYYGDGVIGEVRSPPGNAGARKTMHMNVTIEVMVDMVTRVSRFRSDVFSGLMPVATTTDIHGRVNVLNVIKKHIDVELNCTMNVVLSTQTVKDKVCKRTIHM